MNRRLFIWAAVALVALVVFANTGFIVSQTQQAIVVTALARLASGVSVTTVALDCGYSNAGAFTSMFRRITGATPTDYVAATV